MNPFHNSQVAVVGDLVLDQMIYGWTERVSREAPIPVIRVQDQEFRPGGAANLVANLTALGGQVSVLGAVGPDIYAKEMANLLENEQTQLTLIESSQPTTVKARLIAQRQQVARFDYEPAAPVDETIAQIITVLPKLREQADVVVLSDYGYGIICEPVVAAAKELWADGKILLDPRPRSGLSYTGVSGMTPNLEEAAKLADLERLENDDESVIAAAEKILNENNADFIALTRSSKGITLLEKGKTPYHSPAKILEVTDVSGAGDTVLATYALGVAAGIDLREVTDLANRAAGRVVRRLGAATTTWEEIAQ